MFSNPYVLSESLLMAKTMSKKNLKIQILAGNTLMSKFHVGFEIELPLGEDVMGTASW